MRAEARGVSGRAPSVRATNVVLFLLCLMYAITYIDRVNVSTAAAAFREELHLTNTQVGLVFSAFAYPYLVFQIIGGWVGDRFGAHRALTLAGIIWASATVLMGLAGGLMSILVVRVMLGFGEGATFPVATRAMSDWTPAGKRGFAQGITHSAARLGNALTPPLIAWLILLVTLFVSGLDSSVFSAELSSEPEGLGAVFRRRVFRWRGRRHARRDRQRSDFRSDQQPQQSAPRSRRHRLSWFAALHAADSVRPRHLGGRHLFESRVLLLRIHHWTDVGDSDGHRPAVRRIGERPDE